MEELITCEGTVHSVIFQNAENGYTVLRLLTEEGEVVTVVGCIPCVAPGEHLAVSGVWERHPQHGEQLRAVELERTLPEDEEEIFSYLSSGICKGVGPATARRIVDRFGPATLDILEREPERLNLTQGRHRQKGPGDRRELPPPHGAPAADGVPGPVPAAAGPGHAAAPAVRRRGAGDGAGQPLPPLRRRVRRGLLRHGRDRHEHGPAPPTAASGSRRR